MKRYALITGASRGIGRAIAIELAKDGCSILLNYKSNHAAAEEAKRLIEEAGGEAELMPFDVSQPDAINAALNTWFAAHPDEYIDVLVNNAGVTRDNLLLNMMPEEWHSVINTNLNSFFYITRRLLLDMLVHHHGRIVNVASVAGIHGYAGKTNYSAAKAALVGATKSLAIEVAPKQITVNAVAPGAIETEMIKSSEKEYMAKHIAMQRLGRAEEVAELVSFLSSEKATYITGQVIEVDGGGEIA